MSDGYDVALCGKDVRLSKLDVLVAEPCRSQNHEDRLAVYVQLRSLMGAERILDREIVQPELALQRAQKGSYRLEPVEGGTRVDYELEIELVVPVIGRLRDRAERRILSEALRELKRRAESR